MLPRLQQLIRLQEAASRAAEARKRIADAPGEIAALDARLTAATEAVAAARQSITEAHVERRTLDRDLISAQQRLSKYKDQLMEVKTNAEYHAMQHQISAATDEVGKVEELILVNMLKSDELNATLKATEAALTADESGLAKERAAIQADATEKERVLADSEQERGTLISQIDRGDLETFERLFKARQSIAVAPAVDGHCSICHVRLRPQVYNTIITNEAIVQCDHCQRILFFAGVAQRSAAGHAAIDAAQTRQDEHTRPAP